MQRVKTLIPLSHDHYHGLQLAQLLKKNAPPYKGLPNTAEEKIRYAIEFYETDLVIHFRNEEDILYPYIKGRDTELDEMFDDIIAEHKMIQEYISKLDQSSDKENDMDRLGRLLESHIRKEERVVFPKIQQVFPEDALRELDDKISSVRKDKK